MAWFIGLMSGTSLDGVDALLAESTHDLAPLCPQASLVHLPFAPALRDDLLALNRPGPDEMHRAALAANAIARLYAQAVAQLLREHGGLRASDIVALGAHGQTVRHRPREFDGVGYTCQLLNGALLAELSGIDVVCDFRRRDLAAGGEGAPLAPGFHAASFARDNTDVAVLNLGGIANLSLLPARGPVRGFDCGPGNVLLDLWCQRHLGQAFDDSGAWAAGGTLMSDLLGQALADPFFARQPPKSTGRDLFNAEWLARLLAARPSPSAQNVMNTLAELTARAAADALLQAAPRTTQLLVCGGGAHNRHLLARLAALLGPAVSVASTASRGVDPGHVECLAFAWLAREFIARRPGNLPAVTGARGSRVLGALYPAA